MGQKIALAIKAEIIQKEMETLYPQARCELNYVSALDLLVAVMLSQQSTDVSINKLTKTLFKEYTSLEDYVNVPLARLEADLHHIGLYKNKAKNIKAMASIVKNEYLSIFPNDQDKLERLPGVGRKTANVFLAEWYHEPRIAVDTHVKRVASRLGLAKENDSVLNVENILMKLYEPDQWIKTHHQFLFFGRYFCKAKKPRCSECPLINQCLKPFF